MYSWNLGETRWKGVGLTNLSEDLECDDKVNLLES